MSLEDFRGQVVVLNLWATWCAPCRHEMPSLDRLQAQQGGPDLQVAAAVGRPRRARADRGLLRGGRHPASRRSIATRKDAAGRALGALGLPTTVVIDQAGREVGRLLGPAEWDSAEALALLRSLIEPEQRRG